MDDLDRALIANVQDGIGLEPRPFVRVAERLGVEEPVVLARLEALRREGVIKRFGVVVRHHELGYRANAMAVWNVADGIVDELGGLLALHPAVTLCYRRPRRPPRWPYNLFCMIHGRSEERVRATVARLCRDFGLQDREHAVLFSRRRYKQRGGRYVTQPDFAPDRGRREAIANG